jgi:alkyldihydroxyacetonephosphate synthase
VLFRDFAAGFAFLRAVQRSGVVPASVRLMDNLQFQFGQALRPERTGLAALKGRLEKAFVTKLRGFDPERMVACTLLFEGGREEVEAQERSVYRLAARHGGMKAGGENGERGYQLTFAIAYIRDFMLEQWVLGESFETSVAWSEAEALCSNVKQRIWQEHTKRGLPGRPFVSCRVTQLYDTGVCIYFYFAFHYKGVEHASEVYAELERAARDEILRSGGSLSHHHGVGKLRQPFLPRVFSPAALAWRQKLKAAVDPENVLGCGNG